jgi:hypothetical protein
MSGENPKLQEDGSIHAYPFIGEDTNEDGFVDAVPLCGYDDAGNAVPIKVNENGEVKMEQTGSNVLNHGSKNVASAGTAEQLPAQSGHEVLIIAKKENTGYVYVGGSTVSSTSFGADLVAKESISLPINNANLAYIDADVSGEGVTYFVF